MSLKVLTIDDSKMIRTVVTKAFSPFDCEIFEGENGAKGLEIANRETPDLVVLDITMPVMNGVEMLEGMKKTATLKDIPVIMLTAESAKENVLQIVQMGVNDYIVKPFKGEELIERVKKLVTLEPAKVSPESVEEETSKFFQTDGNMQILVLPQSPTPEMFREISNDLQPRIERMPKSNLEYFVCDLSKVVEVTLPAVKLIVSAAATCAKLDIKCRLVGDFNLSEELKRFQETADLPVYRTVNDATAPYSDA